MTGDALNSEFGEAWNRRHRMKLRKTADLVETINVAPPPAGKPAMVLSLWVGGSIRRQSRRDQHPRQFHRIPFLDACTIGVDHLLAGDE